LYPPNGCLLAACGVSQSVLKRLHFLIQIIHHPTDFFLSFFSFDTFGLFCGDFGRGKSASLYFLQAIVETP
jgi:hypothetical protein